MRYSTAVILSVIVIGVMFGLPLVTNAVVGPYEEHGLEIPHYTRMLLEIGFSVSRFRYVFTLPIVLGLFLFAGVTSESHSRRRDGTPRHSRRPSPSNSEV